MSGARPWDTPAADRNAAQSSGVPPESPAVEGRKQPRPELLDLWVIPGHGDECRQVRTKRRRRPPAPEPGLAGQSPGAVGGRYAQVRRCHVGHPRAGGPPICLKHKPKGIAPLALVLARVDQGTDFWVQVLEAPLADTRILEQVATGPIAATLRGDFQPAKRCVREGQTSLQGVWKLEVAGRVIPLVIRGRTGPEEHREITPDTFARDRRPTWEQAKVVVDDDPPGRELLRQVGTGTSENARSS